jgi:hypothetical protein
MTNILAYRVDFCYQCDDDVPSKLEERVFIIFISIFRSQGLAQGVVFLDKGEVEDLHSQPPAQRIKI